MDYDPEGFPIDSEINGENLSKEELLKRVDESLKGVKKGHYLLVSVNDYSLVAEIAKAIAFKMAAVDTVLKKGHKRWIVMIKNDVPVAQLDRA